MSSAVRRIQRDLEELCKNPLPFVCAAPDQDDLMSWSATFLAEEGWLCDVPIHVHITFTDKYPADPPAVKMITPGFMHPNVFSTGYICLDMLKKYGSSPYQGWSSAYTVSSASKKP